MIYLLPLEWESLRRGQFLGQPCISNTNNVHFHWLTCLHFLPEEVSVPSFWFLLAVPTLSDFSIHAGPKDWFGTNPTLPTLALPCWMCHASRYIVRSCILNASPSPLLPPETHTVSSTGLLHKHKHRCSKSIYYLSTWSALLSSL